MRASSPAILYWRVQVAADIAKDAAAALVSAETRQTGGVVEKGGHAARVQVIFAPASSCVSWHIIVSGAVLRTTLCSDHP